MKTRSAALLLIFGLTLQTAVARADAPETFCISNDVFEGYSYEQHFHYFNELASGKNLDSKVFCDTNYVEAFLKALFNRAVRLSAAAANDEGRMVIRMSNGDEKVYFQPLTYVGASALKGVSSDSHGASASVNMSGPGAVRASIGYQGADGPDVVGRVDLVLPLSMVEGRCDGTEKVCATTSLARLFQRTRKSMQVGVLTSLIASVSPLPLSMRMSLDDQDSVLEVAVLPLSVFIPNDNTGHGGGALNSVHARLEQRLSMRAKLEIEGQVGLISGDSLSSITGSHFEGNAGLVVIVNKDWFLRPEVEYERTDNDTGTTAWNTKHQDFRAGFMIGRIIR